MRTAAALLVTLGLLAGLAAPALAAPEIQGSSATLPDIEDEVMCTVCGTTLQLSESPQANQERALINRLIAQGKDKQQIKDELVAEYGPEVLAVPSTEGFDLTAWVVPILGGLIALVSIALAARRWRRRGDGGGDDDARASGQERIDPDDDERLSADLARYEV